MCFSINRPIAIIDSGIGGISVLKQLINKFGYGNYIYFADNQNMPYGNKTKQFVQQRMDYIIKLLQQKYNAELVIIACNTASTSIEVEKYKNVFAMQFNEYNVYFATNLTKQNLNYINVIADNNLPKLIEQHIFNKHKLKTIINETIKLHNLANRQQVVLACTHYELALNLFKKLAPNTKFVCNSTNIINSIKVNNSHTLKVKLLMSKEDELFKNKFFKLLNQPLFFS